MIIITFKIEQHINLKFLIKLKNFQLNVFIVKESVVNNCMSRTQIFEFWKIGRMLKMMNILVNL